MAEIQVRVKTADDLPGPLGSPPILHPTRSQTLQVPDNYLFLQGSTLGSTQFQELQRMPVGDRGLAIVGGRVTLQEGAVSRNPWTGNRIGTSGAQEALNDYKILMRRHNVPTNMQSQRAMHDFSLYNRAHGVQRPRINVHSADAQARQEYTAGSEEVLGALLGGVGFGVGSVAIKGVGKGIAWLAAKEAARRAAIEKGVEWTAGAGFAGMFGYHTAVSGGKNITDPWVGKVSDQAGLFSTLSGGMYPGPDIPLSSGLATGANRFMGMVAPFAIAMMGKQGWKEFRGRNKPAALDPSLDTTEGSGGNNKTTKAIVIEGFAKMGMDISWLISFERHANPVQSGFYATISSLGKIFHGAKELSPEIGFHESKHNIQNLTPEANTAYFEKFSRDFAAQNSELAAKIGDVYKGSGKNIAESTHGKESQAFLFAEWMMSQTGIRVPSLVGNLASAVRSAFKEPILGPGLKNFVKKEFQNLLDMADRYGLGYLGEKSDANLRIIQANLKTRINEFKNKNYDTSALEKRLEQIKEYLDSGRNPDKLPASEQKRPAPDEGYTGFEENLGEGVFREGNDPANITSPRGPTGERPAAPRDLATALGDLGIGLETSDGKYTSLVRKNQFDKPDKDRIRNQFASIMDNQNPGGNPSREAGIKVIELAEAYRRAVKEGRMDDADAIRLEALRTIRAAEGMGRPIFGFVGGPGATRPPAGPAPSIPPRGTAESGILPEPAPKPKPKPKPNIRLHDSEVVPEVIPEVKPPEVVPEVTPEIKPPEIIPPEVKPPEVVPEVVPEVKPPKPAPAPEVIPEVPIVPVPDAPGVPPRPEIIAGVPRPGPRIQPGRVPLPVPALPIPLVPGPKPKRTTPTDIDFPGFDKSAGYWLPVAPSFHSGQWAYPGYIIDSGRLDYNVD